MQRVPVATAIRGPGDDAAVLAPRPGNLVWATDFVIQGRHFNLDWSSVTDAAYKAVARNVSDLAAMGATPEAFLAAVALPEASEELVASIAQGFEQAAADFGIGIVGGDLSKDDHIIFAVTALGYVDGPGLGRDGARAGDLLAVTGTLGEAAAGLQLLQEHHAGDQGVQKILDAHPGLKQRLFRGVARVTAGAALAGRATAAIDVSDGLIADASRLADASGLRVQIDSKLLPYGEGVRAAAAHIGCEASTLVLQGGDDYELLCAISEDALPGAQGALSDLGLTVIGRFEAGSGVVDSTGSRIEGGHDHFA
jgi:thiamine-monophosphate kinase